MIQFSGTTNYIFQNDRAAESAFSKRFKTKTEHHSHRGAGIYWRAVVLELHHFFFSAGAQARYAAKRIS